MRYGFAQVCLRVKSSFINKRGRSISMSSSSAAMDVSVPAAGDSVDVNNLEVGAVIEGDAPVTSLDFHRSGEYLVTASRDATVNLVNALEGKARKKVKCKKYGVELARFTHHEQCILCTSKPHTDNNHDIRYLSLYDNLYLRFFTGHTARVTGLAMSPCDDRFLSASLDGSVRLWTLQQPKNLGVGQLYPNSMSGQTLVSFDPSGLVFAAGAYYKDRHTIKMYDARQFSQGSFVTLTKKNSEIQELIMRSGVAAERARYLAQAQWVGMDFSADGRHLLIYTNSSLMFTVDSYDLTIKQVITGYRNDGQSEIVGCYTPDGRHVLSGSEDHDVYVFDAVTGEEKNRLKGHKEPVRQVACNPKYEVVASACSNTVLWIPK